MQAFDYVKAKTLEEASALLAEHNGDARPFAGATDLLIRIERGFLHPAKMVDIKNLPGGMPDALNLFIFRKIAARRTRKIAADSTRFPFRITESRIHRCI